MPTRINPGTTYHWIPAYPKLCGICLPHQLRLRAAELSQTGYSYVLAGL
jgi:hypothetical protein